MSDGYGPGRDVLRAGPGRDSLTLSGGADRARAGSGSDWLQVDRHHAADVINCGPGNDTVTFRQRERADLYIGCEHFERF